MNETMTGYLDHEEASRDAILAPVLFLPRTLEDIEAFAAARPGLRIRDTYAMQVMQLHQTRSPGCSSSEIAEGVRKRLETQLPWEGGTWVHYPWLHALVHILDEQEFGELRTSRNRNKITEAEQQKLRKLRIAVAGLSVGQATAITLAMEEVAGELRLADFDTLELSNMNRLRASVADLGLAKTVLTARAIYEINPYANVHVFSDGVTSANLDDFLGGDRPVDILVEECDDLEMKLLLRERARERGIAVVMETSDRGMLDVERFDLEPERETLHGLVAGVSASQVRGMSTREKVPVVLRLIGAEQISDRLAASLVDVDTTLKTWPQLASAVAIGGGAATDVCRRVALGTFKRSGRFYLDVEQSINDKMASEISPAHVEEPAERGVTGMPLPLPPLPLRSGPLDPEKAKALLSYGILAPSGGNCQPWQFGIQGDRLLFRLDRSRSKTLLDFESTASFMSLGAVVENCSLLSPALGLKATTILNPDSHDPDCVAEMRFREMELRPDAVAWADIIAERCTNRKLGDRAELPDELYTSLSNLVAEREGKLQFVRDDGSLAELAAILAEGDRLRLLHRRMHREMMSEIRWTRAEAERTRDGLDVDTLELSAADVAGMRLVSNWRMMSVVKSLGVGRGLEKPTRQAVESASALGLLTIPGTGSASYYKGGRVLQRLWLEATKLKLGFQPMTAILYVFALFERGGAQGLDGQERAMLASLRRRYQALFEVPEDAAEIMLFRLAVVAPPSARSLRKPVDEMLIGT